MTKEFVEVYALLDPFNDEPRYVGWAVNAQKRLQTHMREFINDSMAHWINSLLETSNRPVLKILENTSWEARYTKEKEYINKFLDAGFFLLNHVGNRNYWKKFNEENAKVLHWPKGPPRRISNVVLIAPTQPSHSLPATKAENEWY